MKCSICDRDFETVQLCTIYPIDEAGEVIPDAVPELVDLCPECLKKVEEEHRLVEPPLPYPAPSEGYHNPYYCSNGLEAYEVIGSLHPLALHFFILGNIIKYAIRAGRKPGETLEEVFGKIRNYAEKGAENSKALTDIDLQEIARNISLADWQSFPRTVPPEKGAYLVTILTVQGRKMVREVDRDFWYPGEEGPFGDPGRGRWESHPAHSVIAWAPLPEWYTK